MFWVEGWRTGEGDVWWSRLDGGFFVIRTTTALRSLFPPQMQMQDALYLVMFCLLNTQGRNTHHTWIPFPFVLRLFVTLFPFFLWRFRFLLWGTYMVEHLIGLNWVGLVTRIGERVLHVRQRVGVFLNPGGC